MTVIRSNAAINFRNGVSSFRQRLELALAEPGYRDVLYVSPDGHHLTTWTGDRVARITRWGQRHNWSPSRRYFTAHDNQGRTWFGTGEEGMWAPVTLGKG